MCCSVKTNKGWQACLLVQPAVAVEVFPRSSSLLLLHHLHPPSSRPSWYTYVAVCGGLYRCIRKLGGEFLLKQTPERERVVGASGGGLQRSGKERICKGKPRDPVSVSEGRQSVSFPSAQKRTSTRINEPDILIRRGKCSREPEERFFIRVGR